MMRSNSNNVEFYFSVSLAFYLLAQVLISYERSVGVGIDFVLIFYPTPNTRDFYEGARLEVISFL
jgi:hypothetical protein